MACSRGWSEARRMAGGAQPVGEVRRRRDRPGRGGGISLPAGRQASPRRGEKKRIVEKKRTRNALAAHGFRVGPLGGRAAPPAATIRGPAGAQDGSHDTAAGDEPPRYGPAARIAGGVLHPALVSALPCMLCALGGRNTRPRLLFKACFGHAGSVIGVFRPFFRHGESALNVSIMDACPSCARKKPSKAIENRRKVSSFERKTSQNRKKAHDFALPILTSARGDPLGTSAKAVLTRRRPPKKGKNRARRPVFRPAKSRLTAISGEPDRG
jgi:hypothetical protein